MTTKEMALKNYSRGLWTDDMLAKLVAKGKISAADYEEITGTQYTGDVPATITEAELNNAYTEGVNSL